MILVADESVDKPIVDKLRQENHEIFYIAEITTGIADDDVLSLANQNQALLITVDKNFGELVFRQRKTAFGIILIG